MTDGIKVKKNKEYQSAPVDSHDVRPQMRRDIIYYIASYLRGVGPALQTFPHEIRLLHDIPRDVFKPRLLIFREPFMSQVT